jgi:hypothetical protein
MAKTKGKSKKELLTEQIALAVGAGREVAVETVDFSDPNRSKTCLEVDFPIIPINQIAAIEGNAGKPIYQMSKWWARRRSSVFRSMLLAAAMKAPDDESKAAKAVWDVYYANHLKRGSLRHLKVADPFMGGGTTIVEGSRLGMRMFGCDLNPVAWFVVENEMAQVDIAEVKHVLAAIEAEVKPQIMPYYACDGPNGEKGKWFRRSCTRERKKNSVQLNLAQRAQTTVSEIEDDWEELPTSFDIFSVPWLERKHYRYEGPEILYTFWSKHGPCQREGCGHRTPIMSSPVVAIKTLTVDAWLHYECCGCGENFDVERHATRMAPDSPLFVAPGEKPFAVMDDKGQFTCPHCGKTKRDERALARGDSSDLGKAKSKKVELTLLIHPQWLEGCPNQDESGREYGGSATDSVEATIRWNNARAAKLRLLEVRGLVPVEKVNKKGERKTVTAVPPEVTCPETKVTFFTDERGGTITKGGHFECQGHTRGKEQPNSESFAKSGKTAPIANFLIQGYSPNRNAIRQPYGGRFFIAPQDPKPANAAWAEWEARKDADLSDFWPRTEIPFGHMTHQRQPLPDHGYTHWWKMFNPRQLLVNSLLLKEISQTTASYKTRMFVLGFYQNFLRNENLFCFWHESHDHFAPHLSNNNYHPKTTVIEVGPFCPIGYGPWPSATGVLDEALQWREDPWEIFPADGIAELAGQTSGKGVRVLTQDPVHNSSDLVCKSATDWPELATKFIDLVITDPPFGGLLHYSELSDFFYVWLRLALKESNPEAFASDHVLKALEAVSNEARHPDDPDKFYQRILTDCWREAYRVLKPGGILAFTFHHNEDDPWVQVLESLFDAGFYLEAAYPIRSDETKGEGEFGSKQVEYDIIHVCRKRMTEPQPISWARLRRQIVDDVRHLKRLLEQHRSDGLPAADMDIIRRGKALEHFSRHYGKVYIEQGREFGISEALPAIKQIVDEESDSLRGTESPPTNAEPYTRQFFRLFYETTQVPRDQIQKFLRGTGIAPSDFEERGWCSEKNKIFSPTPPIELARSWKGVSRKGMARDFDQTMFLVGGCFEGSNIRLMDTLDSPNFAPHPATAELVDWLTRHGGSQEIKFAAQRAQTIYRDWLGRNKAKAQEQIKLFDLED